MTLRTGIEGCTLRALATSEMRDVYTKSRIGWYSISSWNTGWDTSVPGAPSRTVYPSGGDLATSVEPILPPAPPRFSTSTVCPKTSVSPGAMVRAVISMFPLGANGTTMRIGLDG